MEGFATMACGGTHPKSTGEVGAQKLKRKNTGKGKERIDIT
ncbi:alanine-tRNA synthetase second additional domain-containing protein [Klebsiella pneumoniae]|nr:alanine-tRNA synthetase second additional domain-containing protein [Klebsiella pneumoniae]MEC4511869.1 alanine-tRNA synthetase second additional domain-containing protein [Klebsiella pneumoniae]